MAKKESENIGRFVITGEENMNSNHLICSFCDKILANINKDDLSPNVEKLIELKNVPIPNFGWFCSQECGNRYSEKYSVNFQRNENGEIEYYL